MTDLKLHQKTCGNCGRCYQTIRANNKYCQDCRQEGGNRGVRLSEKRLPDITTLTPVQRYSCIEGDYCFNDVVSCSKYGCKKR